MAEPLTVYYVEALGRSVALREGTSDAAVLRDTFQGLHHVPPVLVEGGWSLDYEPMSVLDLGCNIGLTVAHYAAMWPSARIVGVDLDDGNLRVARINTQRLAGIDLLRFAVAGGPGKRRYRRDNVEEWAYRVEPTQEGELVDATTLDSLATFITGSAADAVDFVKMDIEGAEAEVLKSAGGWPLRVRHLLVECHTPYTVEEAIADLERRGFEARPHKAHPSAVWAW